MARKAAGEAKFDEKAYRKEWNKQNMKMVGASYKKEFVEEYRQAVQKLGLKTSDLIRSMMEEVIKQARKQQ